MKIDIPKDWCIAMAKIEDGQEIGAGSPNHPLRADPMRDYLEQRERDLETRIAGLEALLCDAQSEADRFRGALQQIAWSDNDGSYMGERHAKCCELARGALKGKP